MKCLGIDVGKKQDPSAITSIEGNGQTFKVVAAQALPLSMPYDEQTSLFEEVSVTADMVLVDCGGPGQPVIDMMRKNGAKNVWAVAITSGKRIYVSEEHQSINVPKGSLIANLSLHAEKRLLHVPEAMRDLRSEMLNFHAAFTPSGNVTMQAKKGHDDIVLSAALAMIGFRIREFLE